MSKVIEIKSCIECPHFGGITAGIAEPFCKKMKQVIPYESVVDVPFPPHRYPKEIPDWCPLESTEDFCESNFKI